MLNQEMFGKLIKSWHHKVKKTSYVHNIFNKLKIYQLNRVCHHSGHSWGY